MTRTWIHDGRTWVTGPPPKGCYATYDVPLFIEWVELGHRASLSLALAGGGLVSALPAPAPSNESGPPKPKRRKARDTKLVYTPLWEPEKGRDR